MPAKINVVNGPDQGRTFHLNGPEVRIGRGPGNQVSLRDPSLAGTLRIECRNALYFVHNETGSAAYLDGQPFPSGERRPWYHNGRLQPTADTVMELEVVDSPAGVKGDGPVVESTQATGSTPKSKRTQMAIIAICAPLALAGFLMDSKESAGGRSETDVRVLYERMESDLRDLSAKPGSGGRTATSALKHVHQGRIDEVRGAKGPAFNEYRRVVKDIDASLANTTNPIAESDAEVLRKARTMLNDRLLELGAAGAAEEGR